VSQPNSGLLRLTNDNSDYIDITIPNYPYSIKILLAMEIQLLDKGKVDIYDYATNEQYDKRECEIVLDLNSSQALTLNNWLRIPGINNMRSTTGILEFATDSGCFPFGPDKSPEGPYTVAVNMTGNAGVQESPFQYFRETLNIINTGVFPSYILPTEIDNGTITVGTVNNLRFPPNWFKPRNKYAYSTVIEEDSSAQFVNKGIVADNYFSSIEFVLNESKAAALIKYLTQTVRSNAFTIITQNGQYPFGREKGDGTFNVKLASNEIDIVHERYNRFRINLFVNYISKG